MRRVLSCLALTIVGLLVLAAPAAAGAPISERESIDDHFVDDFLSEECGTTIHADVTGHAIFRVWLNEDDEPIRELNNFAISIRWSSANGWILAKDVGADRITYLEDGSVIQVVIGSVRSFSAAGLGRIYADVGRTVFLITFDGAGDPQVEMIHQAGQHDEDQLAAICEALGA